MAIRMLRNVSTPGGFFEARDIIVGLTPLQEAALVSNSNAEQVLADIGMLSAAQVAAISGSSLESAGVDWALSPSLLLDRMNTGLARGGLQTLTRPGQYVVGGPGQGGILIPSYSHLLCSPGVELILADGTQSPLLRTANSWHSTPITVPTALAFSSINTSSGLVATANATGVGTKHPVGSWVAVMGLDPSIANNRAYMGVFQVYAASADSITFHIVDWPIAGTNSSAGAKIYPADSGIRVTGGIWDGNDVGQGAPGFPAGDPREHTMHFRNAQDIIVRNAKFRRGMSWSVGTNNIRDATFEHLRGDLYEDGLGSADVLFQGSGGGRNVIVQNVAGFAKDNLVAWSLDTVGTSTYLNHEGGNTYNIKFRDIELQGNGVCGVVLWGNTNYRHHGFIIDGVSGRTMSEGLVKVDCGYAPTAMLNTRGNKLTIKNVDGNCASTAVSIRSDGDWEHIDIDNVRNSRTTSHPGAALVSFIRSVTKQVIGRVDIKNLQHSVQGATLNKNAPSVIISDTDIDRLTIEGMPAMRLAAGTSLIAFTGTQGIVNNAVITNVNAVANASGDSFLVSCENTNAGALGQLTLRDSSFTAFDATGGLVRQATTGRVTRIRVDNCTQSNGEDASGVVRDNATGGQRAVLDTVSVASSA